MNDAIENVYISRVSEDGWMVREKWDPATSTLTFEFNKDFWNLDKQNLLLTDFEGVVVTCHEANIRRMVRQLQSVAATGQLKEE